EGVARLVGGGRLDGIGAVTLRGPAGQRGAAGRGGSRIAGGGAVAGRQVGDRGLPGRAVPVVFVRGALEGEGGAVGVEADAAAVVGHAATETGRHGAGAEEAAAGRGGHRCRARHCVVQGEADGGAGEGVARLVGGLRLDRVGAVALRGPGGQG